MVQDKEGDTCPIPGKSAIVKPESPIFALTGKVINCVMEVRRVLGNGFQEEIYQRPLAKEMTFQGLPFSREHEMEIGYNGASATCRS